MSEAKKESFTRRGLLQWTVPVILGVTLPSQTYAGTHSDHADHHDMHGDSHDDKHQDHHGDGHQDSHDDALNPSGR